MRKNIILGVILTLVAGAIIGFAIGNSSYRDDSMMHLDEDKWRDKESGKESQSETEQSMGMDHSTNGEDMAGMHSMSVTDERTFIEGMIPHHQEAIDTAKEVLARGATTDEMKRLAEGIITSQEKEIADMKSWYQTWYKTAYVDSGTYEPMMQDLTSLSGAELDRAFLNDMIMHHMGAIMMARSVTPHIEHPEIQALAEAIVVNQSNEIIAMRILLKKI